MTTRIDRLETDVTPVPESDVSGGEGTGDTRWAELERLAVSLERRRWLEERLSAEGFDD